MSEPNYYWDSCVFNRYLTEIPPDNLDDIDAFMEDAKKGLCHYIFRHLHLLRLGKTH
jgi:hypothetical protein